MMGRGRGGALGNESRAFPSGLSLVKKFKLGGYRIKKVLRGRGGGSFGSKMGKRFCFSAISLGGERGLSNGLGRDR